MAEDSDISLRRITRGDFETVVEVIGNPIRRRIIQKLSEGPDYTLRLSNELNINQQLASKHMKIIRDAELVDVIRQKSDKGPEKKMFSLNKFYSLQIDFSPIRRLLSFRLELGMKMERMFFIMPDFLGPLHFFLLIWKR